MSNYNKPSKGDLNHWYEDPTNWKYGFIYYNKKDKRIFVPKRFKYFGWTLNAANPYSFLFFIVIILFIVFVEYLK